MSITRSSVLKGPGYFVRDSVTFHTNGIIAATPNLTRFDIATSRSGKVDERTDDVTWPVTFTPTGELSEALLGALYPAGYLNPTIGASIFPSSDKTLAITGITHTTGNVFTLKATALTKMPVLNLSAARTLFGEAEFTGIRQDNTPWSTDGSIGALSDQGSPAATDSDPANIPTEPADAAWGSIITSFETEAGWTVEPTLTLTPVKTDREGTIDMTIADVGFLAKCRPMGTTMAQVLNNMSLQGTSMARGVSTRTRSADLTLTTTAITCVLKNAALVTAGFRWGATELRQGEIGFVTSRAYSTGAYGALMTLAAN